MIDECEVYLCAKEATFNGLCVLHRKKAVAGELDEDDNGTLYDTCSRGHRWEPNNILWERTPKGGRRRRCRACRALKGARRNADTPGASPPDPVRPKNKRMARVMDAFDKAQVQVKGLCYQNYKKWTDYTADNIPTATQAHEWCDGCPLLQLCDNTASQTKPGWGVWGGRVWVYGQPYDRTKRNLLHPDD